jgi:NADH-quinone oxidoreductase subunit C
MTEQDIHQRLLAEFEEAILGFDGGGKQPAIAVEPLRLREVALYLRDQEDLAFNRCLVISGVDWDGFDESGKGKHREINRYEEDGTVDPVQEAATGDLGVVYFLESARHGHRVKLSVRLPRENPLVDSLAGVWTTAEWGERETYDFYGIDFVGHPDQRRILLPEDWVGWPLRKDYQMPSRYHDVPLEGMPYAVREER